MAPTATSGMGFLPLRRNRRHVYGAGGAAGVPAIVVGAGRPDHAGQPPGGGWDGSADLVGRPRYGAYLVDERRAVAGDQNLGPVQPRSVEDDREIPEIAGHPGSVRVPPVEV